MGRRHFTCTTNISSNKVITNNLLQPALARLRHEFSWGVADIVVDEKFLLQGKLKLESLNVLFPDGVWLDSKNWL